MTRPLAPDFAPHPMGDFPTVALDDVMVVANWPDGLTGRFYGMWLRENEVSEGINNTETRERDVEIDTFAKDTAPSQARLAGKVLEVTFAPDGHVAQFDLGWLRSMAEGRWRPGFDLPDQQFWTANQMPEPPSFNGPEVLQNDIDLEAWLTAAWRFGFARLRDLPTDAGTVQRVGERIGTVRSSNFGFLFSVETKPNPDSNAYTSAALDGHTDLASRETQPGLQILMCRENSASGGASTMVDGFAVADAIRRDNPDSFDALTTLSWVFSNRHRDSDYRYSGPIVELDPHRKIVEIRNTGFLRAYPDMDEKDMPRAYTALRLFTELARSDRFTCRTPFAAGDAVLFDNRRILHGRDSFNPQSGVRRLEGCYLDRDEIFSRLRILARGHRNG